MIKNKNSIIFFLCLLWCFIIKAQVEDKITIVHALNEISISHNITFNYESSLLEELTVFPVPQNLKLTAKIKYLEKQTDLVFSIISEAVISITKTIKICGYLMDASKNPIINGTLQSPNDNSITDQNGFFEIKLTSINELITIRFLGFKTIERKGMFFNVERCNTITMLVQEEDINPITLSTYLIKGIDKRQDGSTSINYKRFTLLPGLIESDVLQTIQALPGVLSVDETVSNINIRGGSHDQNLILWDDIKMYQSGHFFGLISSFNPNITQTTNIINNGTDVRYSEGVSSTINMQTDKNLEPRIRGVFGLNLLNADVFVNLPLGTKSSVQLAARKSLDDFIRTPTYEAYFDRVTQDTEAQANIAKVISSNQEFNFYDTSLRWLYKPTAKDELRLNFILINNDLTFDETGVFNNTSETRESSVSQNSIAAGLNYKRKWSDKLSTIFNLYETDYKLQAINSNILAGQRFLQENIVSESGLKVEAIYHQNDWKFKLGYNFVETEITNLNDIDLPRFIRRNSEVLREHAAFTQAQFQNQNKDFIVRTGVRVNYINKFKKLLLEPRLSIRKKLGNNIEIEALTELKHQNVSQIVNFQSDFLGIEKRRWQLANNDSIPIIKSKQSSIGILYKNNGWLFDLKAYYKNVVGITTQSQGFTTKYEFKKEKGSYDVLGFEFLFRKKINKMNSWLSYSYIKNDYTFEALEEVEFPSNFDITHSVTVGSTYSTKSLNISAGVNYRTGKPTSVPLLDTEVLEDEVNFDKANTNRLDNYLRLDTSITYTFKVNTSLRSEIGASVWNITNKENFIYNYYRINSTNSPDKFSRFSLGTTTNIVFRLFFN